MTVGDLGRWPAIDTGTGSSRPSWADGYMADTIYIDQVNTDLSPAWFSMISVLNGQPPIETDRPIVWLDVACGTGLGACAVAAGNPNVEVWGFDYNPAHIERARHLAADACLANCHFVEASFEELASSRTIGPPEADVVVVNGVYSWVSSENRKRIIEVIGQRLRPGGLAHVMYKAATGWSSMTPVAEALRLHADADARPGFLSFHGAAAELLALRDNGALSFPMGAREAEQMELWRTADPQYAAHEYLGAHFTPLMVDDVVAAIGDAKCSLLGSIGPLDHEPFYSTPTDHADLLGSLTDQVTRELLRDLLLRRPLRRDLFRRGRAPSTAEDQLTWISDLQIRSTGRRFVDEPFDVPAMKVILDPAYHEPLVEVLAERDLDIDTISEVHPDWTLADARSALGLLVAAGYATPLVSGGPTTTAVKACRRLNETLLRGRTRGWAYECVADPSSGAMIDMDLAQAIALDGIWTGAPADADSLVAMVEAAFAAQGRVVREHNELIHDQDRAREILQRRVAGLLDRRPALRRRGVE